LCSLKLKFFEIALAKVKVFAPLFSKSGQGAGQRPANKRYSYKTLKNFY